MTVVSDVCDQREVLCHLQLIIHTKVKTLVVIVTPLQWGAIIEEAQRDAEQVALVATRETRNMLGAP